LEPGTFLLAGIVRCAYCAGAAPVYESRAALSLPPHRSRAVSADHGYCWGRWATRPTRIVL